MHSVIYLFISLGCLIDKGIGVEFLNQRSNFADVPVHAGFMKIGGRFPDKILDIQTFQSDDLNGWYEIHLQTDSVNNSLVLHKFDGRSLETILRSSQPIDVGQCRKFSFFKSPNLGFVIAYDCTTGEESMHIYLLEDEVQLTFKKLPPLSMANVYDVAMWDNPTVRSTYLMVIGQKWLSKVEKAYYLRYDPIEDHFTSLGYVKVSKPTSITPFSINGDRYVAVASPHDKHAGLSESQLFIQSDANGHLMKFQKLLHKGIVAISYFNFNRGPESEHFLISAIDYNINIKDTSGSERHEVHYDESVIYKFDDGFFIPFQTLSIPSPTKFIFIGDTPILLSWSLIGGLYSFQYDGWRFTRTKSDQHLLGHLRDIPGELRKISYFHGDLFTFVSLKGESHKLFFRPTFNTSSLAFDTYQNDLRWCENTSKEIHLVKKRLNNYYPYGDDCKTDEVYTDENKIYALIYQAFRYVHNITENEITNEEVTICCGREKAGQEDLNINSSIKDSEEPLQRDVCKTRREFIMENASHVAALSVGLVFQTGTETSLHPILLDSQTYDKFNITKLGQLKQKNMLVTGFSKVNLCSSDGIYIEGVYKGKMLGGVYTFNETQGLSLVQTLNLPGRSTVKGICMDNNLNCFMVASKTKGICSFQCPSVFRPVFCNSPNSFDVLKSSYYTLLSVNPQNDIVVSRLRNGTFFNLGRLATRAVSPKIIASANIQGSDYVLIQNGSRLELCRFFLTGLKNQFTSECENVISRIQKPHYLQLVEVNNSVGIYFGDFKSIDLYIKSGNGFITNRIVDYEYNHFTSFNIANKLFVAVLENTDYILYSIECRY